MNSKGRVFIFSALAFLSDVSHTRADAVYDPSIELDHADSFIPWLIFFLLVGIISLIQLFSRGLMLQKRTNRGWRIIIPFYGRYLEYKNYWRTKYFWINIGFSLYMLISAIGINHLENETVSTFLAIPFLIALAVVAVNRIRLRMNTLELFDFNQYLGLLGIIGLGFITDFLCGFSKTEKKEEKEKTDSNQEQQENISKWE
jgi:hypothetical protein